MRHIRGSDDFKDNAVSLKVTMHIDDCMDSGAISSDIREAIIQAFRDNGIPLNHLANMIVSVKRSCEMGSSQHPHRDDWTVAYGMKVECPDMPGKRRKT